MRDKKLILTTSILQRLGKKWKKNVDGYFTSDYETACYNHENGYYPVSINDKIHFSRKLTKTRMRKNNLPIYRSIIERSIWHLYETMCKYSDENTEIHGIRTDCIYGSNLVDDEKFINIDRESCDNSKNLGTIKKHAYDLPKVNNNNYTPDVEYFSHNAFINNLRDVDILKMKSCLISGKAGTGKTYRLKEIYKKVGKDDCMVLSFQNKAVDNLRNYGIEIAQTIDKALLQNINGTQCATYANKKFGKKYLLIDEVFSMSSFHWNLIYDIYLKNPNLHIYAFGDPNQTVAIEVNDGGLKSSGVIYDYTKSQALIDIFENTHELKYIEGKSRYDRKLYDVSNKVLNNKVPELKVGNINDFRRFICYTNMEVDRRNRDVMSKIKNGDDFVLQKRKKGTRSELTNITLEKGSPVVPHSNNKNGLFYNNESFTYHSSTDSHIKLERVNKTILELPIKLFCASFVPFYAGTVHRFQGSKLDEPFCITQIQLMDKNLLYTAITRATKYEDVHIDRKIKKIKQFKYIDCAKINISCQLKIGYIYKIANEINDKIYIGHTIKSIYKRFEQHCEEPIGKGDIIHSKIKKYGSDKFNIELLERKLFFRLSELNRLSLEYRNHYNPEYNYIAIPKKKIKKKIELPKVFNVDMKIKGLSFDKQQNRYRVRIKGLKQKTFNVKKYGGNENAKRKAFEYLTGIIEQE